MHVGEAASKVYSKIDSGYSDLHDFRCATTVCGVLVGVIRTCNQT
ncbi:hypothetical protein [Streptomyces scabiei]|nr:hypothetical protein [Streptomyces scabiei]